MARVVFDGTIAPGQEACSGPGPAPQPAVTLIVRRCQNCGVKAASDGVTLSEDGWVTLTIDGRETNRYWCKQCWPADEVAP